MNIIVEIIAEHLLSNRRLVVPGFGAFMVKDTGERVFADLLRTDDGVLISLLEAKGMSKMEAAIVVDRFIFEVRYELEQYGYCRLGEIGTLRIEPETKALRLCPQVKGEATPAPEAPYVPEPIVEIDEDDCEVETEAPQEEPNVSQGILSLYDEPEKEPVEEVVEPEEIPTLPEEPKDEPKEKPEVRKPRKQPKKKSRKGVDWVIVIAIIVVVAALAVMAYGWYVSGKNVVNVTEDEKVMEQMDSLRIPLPEQVAK